MAIFVPFLQKAETSPNDQAFSSKTEIKWIGSNLFQNRQAQWPRGIVSWTCDPVLALG